MNVQDIREIYDYNYWANQKILDAAEKVTPEQFAAPTDHSFVSLHGTLVHILDTEWGWRTLLQGKGFTTDLKPENLPTVADIRQRWHEDEEAMRAYVDSLRNEDLSGIIRYEIDGGVIRERVLWHCLYHVVNHGMQHRAEAAHLLTRYGQSPGDLDFTVYLNEMKARREQARS